MNTPRFSPLVAGTLLLLGAASFSPLRAQNPPAQEASPEVIAALAREIAAQTDQIRKNQAEMEARMARIEEAVRQARIFAARSGRSGGGN